MSAFHQISETAVFKMSETVLYKIRTNKVKKTGGQIFSSNNITNISRPAIFENNSRQLLVYSFMSNFRN